MGNLLEDALLFGLGSITMAKEEGEMLLREAMKRHNLSDSDFTSVLQALKQEGGKTKESLEETFSEFIRRRGCSVMPCHRRLEEIESRLSALEQKLAGSARTDAPTSTADAQ